MYSGVFSSLKESFILLVKKVFTSESSLKKRKNITFFNAKNIEKIILQISGLVVTFMSDFVLLMYAIVKKMPKLHLLEIRASFCFIPLLEFVNAIYVLKHVLSVLQNKAETYTLNVHPKGRYFWADKPSFFQWSLGVFHPMPG